MKHVWLVALVAMLGAGSVSAEIYRWVDEQGRVHFGDRPNDPAAETVDVPRRPSSSRPTETAAPPTDEPSRLQRWLRAKDEERADQRRTERAERRQTRQRRANCRKARKNWDYYQQGGVFYETRPDGSRHFLDDREMTAEIDRVRRSVRRYCGEDPAAGRGPKEDR